MMPPPQTVLIGAGRLAWHLGQRLHQCGFSVRQVYSRRIEKARELADRLGTEGIDALSELAPGPDWVLLAVPDDAIASVGAALQDRYPQALVTHTSGAAPASLLAPFFPRYGVFYPVQTFSRDREVDFGQIPVCVEASAENDRDWLLEIGKRIGRSSQHVPDEKRAVLHLAAVFANNFSNYLFFAAEKILTEEKLPLDLLRPLILETARKVQDHPPGQMQTGPAIRGDRKTIEKHLELLGTFPQYRELYQLLTRLIDQELRSREQE